MKKISTEELASLTFKGNGKGKNSGVYQMISTLGEGESLQIDKTDFAGKSGPYLGAKALKIPGRNFQKLSLASDLGWVVVRTT